MKIKPFDNTKNQSVGVDAGKTYNAQMLGELMNTNPRYLFSKVDIGQVTDWYTNDDFMEEMLSYVKDTERIDALINFIILKQEDQVINEHHPKVCCRVTDERKYAPYVEGLPAKLEAMRVRIMHSREISAELERMQNRWSDPSQTEVPSGNEINDKTETKQPQFQLSSPNVPIEVETVFHMADFDKGKIKYLLINDDETFTLFVKLMRDEVWPKVTENKNKYSNLLAFVLKAHGVLAKNTNMPQFDQLLQEIIPGIGIQLSSLKQRTDANNKKNLTNFFDPRKCKNDDCYKLTQDAPELEELLQPLFDKMKESASVTE